MTGEGSMNGYVMYDMAKQRTAEKQRTAQRAREAREARAAARGRHSRKEALEAVATPAIPDFADEMFDAGRDAVPAPRREDERGRHARSGR
jgi:hypothetical protein